MLLYQKVQHLYVLVIRHGLHMQTPSYIPPGFASFSQLMCFLGRESVDTPPSRTDQRIEPGFQHVMDSICTTHTLQ